jgi:histone deacetylase 6
MGNGDYKAVWERVLMPLAREFKPDLILVAAGFDAARGDHIGECDVTPDGYAYLTKELYSLGCPVVLSLEGGYNVPSVMYSFAACVAALSGGAAHVDGAAFRPPQPEASKAIERTLTAQKPYWACFR